MKNGLSTMTVVPPSASPSPHERGEGDNLNENSWLKKMIVLLWFG
jgi:hypothetical protein